MFFSTTLFQHQPGLSTVWLLATVNKSLQRREVMDLQINHVCKEISSPAHPMALRLSSQLMYGTVLAMSRQSSSLHADANNLRNRLSFAPLAPRSIDLPQRRAVPQSLVLEDVAVLPTTLPLPEISGVPISGLPQLNMPELITPEVSWAFDDEDDDLGDLDMSFDDNGLLTDNLNIDDFVVDDGLNMDPNSDYMPPGDGVLTPQTPRSPRTPMHSSPLFTGHEIVPVDDLATIQEATQTAVRRRKRVRAAVPDDEISLKMADIRSFRDNYLENMEQQKAESHPRRKRRKTKFAQWKESVLNHCESDPILLLENEIQTLFAQSDPPRRPRPAPAVEVGRAGSVAGTPAPATPGSVEIARRGSNVTSPWSDQGDNRVLGSSGIFGSRMIGSAGTPGSGRARHSRRGGVNSRSGSFGDVDFPDDFPDPYLPDDMPGEDGEYHMLSGTHEVQEFLFHLMSVCQGRTSFEVILPSTLSEGAPNDRATAATSFAKALDLATKGVIKLTGGGNPDSVFIELT